MSARPPLQDSAFRTLWAGQTVSQFGSAVTGVALPLTAILVLGAGPLEMGALVALQQLPVPLFGLFAGVWVDRVRRRPLMVAGQFGRGLLLLSIPVAAAADRLTMLQLWVVAFGVGTLTVVVDLAYTSYLPTVVPRHELIRGHTRLSMSESVAGFAGRGLGGALVQAVGAPFALVVDSLSFFFSGLCLLRIRVVEPHAEVAKARSGLAHEIRDGLRAVLDRPVVASMIATSMVGALGGAMFNAVFVLFMTRDLGLSPFWLGIVLAVAPVAALPGASLAAPASARFGPGPTLVLATAVSAAGASLIPLAAGGAVRIALALGAGQLLFGLGLTLYSVTQISLRQAITPDALLGRVNATRRVVVFGMIPLGALAGGALGEAWGLRSALWAAAGLNVASLAVALLSPLRQTRHLPSEALAT
ncbi:MAG: MFS transporter [Deltaproteobacteria bacterium]|nr:MFS transporter [Deltaproteobacteria bacterium]MBW2413773.1 MFS transporter [Deltaproteobacteria bacterium]